MAGLQEAFYRRLREGWSATAGSEVRAGMRAQYPQEFCVQVPSEEERV